MTVFRVIFWRIILSKFYSSTCSNCVLRKWRVNMQGNIFEYIWSKQSRKINIERIVLATFINVKETLKWNLLWLGYRVVCQDEKVHEKLYDLLKLFMCVFLLRRCVTKYSPWLQEFSCCNVKTLHKDKTKGSQLWINTAGSVSLAFPLQCWSQSRRKCH